MKDIKTKKMLVLGGGFAGVESAILLRKYGYEVTLVSNRDYLFIYPISIWVPTKKKSFDDVKIPLKKLSLIHGFKLIIDEVKAIKHEENKVILKDGEQEYDYLFIALGMSKYYTQGLEHTHSICGNPTESVVIGDELEKLVQKGSGKIAIGFGVNPKDETASAVRGGPAFELLFNISYYLKKKGIRDQFEINFFAPMKEPGKKMGEKPYKKLDVFFKHYKINPYIGKKIVEFLPNSIVFEDKSILKSDLTIYISGGSGIDIIKESGLPTNSAGFLKINELCRVDGKTNIYAIGDIAALQGPTWASKQGHIAEVMANVSTYNLHMELSGKGQRKSYLEKLHIICIMDSGDGAAFILRTKTKEIILPLPILGHWLKKVWGFYYINSKLKKIPRILGL